MNIRTGRTLNWYLKRSVEELEQLNYELMEARRTVVQEQKLLNEALTIQARQERATAVYQEGAPAREMEPEPEPEVVEVPEAPPQVIAPEGIPSEEAFTRPLTLGERFYNWLRS